MSKQNENDVVIIGTKSRAALEADCWDALFKDAVAETAKTPKGKGWLTLSQLCSKWGCGRCKAYKLVNSMIEAGKIERFDGNELRNGKLSRATWYRPVGRK